jgi:HK97 family phage portal protein
MGFKSFIETIFKKRATSYTGSDAWLPHAVNPATGRFLSYNDALTIPAVWRGINALANPVAMLPIFIYSKTDEGREKNPNHPLWKLLRYRPNPLEGAFQFRWKIVAHNILRGNFYAQLIRNGRGAIVEMYALHPDRVIPVMRYSGDDVELYYQVSLPSGKSYELSQYEILHIKGASIDGAIGISPIDLMLRTVDTAIAQEEHTGNFFGRGVKSTGVLTHPSKLSKDAHERLSKSFADTYAGAQNAYRTILLEEGMTWTQVSATNEQSQLIESQKFKVVDFARIIGVPPAKLYDVNQQTFSSLEQSDTSFIKDSVQPWTTNIESAFTIQLLPDREWESTTIAYLLDGYMRGTTVERANTYAVYKTNGIMNTNEIRALENMNKLPGKAGETYLEPLNMVPAGTPRDGNAPAPDAPNTPNGTKNPGVTEAELNNRAWKGIFRHYVERAIKRECIARERKSGTNGNMGEHLRADFVDLVRSGLDFANKGAFDTEAARSTAARILLEKCVDRWLERSELTKDQCSEWLKTRVDLEVLELMQDCGFKIGDETHAN